MKTRTHFDFHYNHFFSLDELVVNLCICHSCESRNPAAMPAWRALGLRGDNNFQSLQDPRAITLAFG